MLNTDEILDLSDESPDLISQGKDLPILLNELNQMNQDNPRIIQLINEQQLQGDLIAIQMAMNNDCKYFPRNKPIKEWQILDCREWATNQNKEYFHQANNLYEIIAIIVRASVLHSGQTPRDIQLITLLILLKSQGCLAEVKTGEGKTKIVSMFAAIKALQFDYIDIVSSSTILARRDAHEMQGFYTILNLTSADNIDGHFHDGKLARSCYSANIVYGDTNEYQWDMVRQIMGYKITRGNRPFNLLFFDEVDSLLVDRSEHSAMIWFSYLCGPTTPTLQLVTRNP